MITRSIGLAVLIVPDSRVTSELVLPAVICVRGVVDSEDVDTAILSAAVVVEAIATC